jgi:hypothetical protein
MWEPPISKYIFPERAWLVENFYVYTKNMIALLYFSVILE